MNTRTFSAKAHEVQRQWWVIDAADQVLGRVAVKAATLLRGKEKPIYTPHCDTGDFVIVINAEKVRLTGKKEEQKTYMSFSGYVGGHKSENVRSRRARRPELLVERAVKGMIPHNRLGRQIITKLKVYSGSEHPHSAQQPTAIPAERTARVRSLPSPAMRIDELLAKELYGGDAAAKPEKPAGEVEYSMVAFVCTKDKAQCFREVHKGKVPWKVAGK